MAEEAQRRGGLSDGGLHYMLQPAPITSLWQPPRETPQPLSRLVSGPAACFATCRWVRHRLKIFICEAVCG